MDVQPVAIMSGLADIQPGKGRLNKHRGANGSTVIDDTYNANPVSVRAAIDVLAEFDGMRLLVLGDLGELGEDEEDAHAQLGIYAKQAGIEHLFTVGELSEHAADAFDSAVHFPDQEQLVDTLLAVVNDETTMLVKGSRGSQMERVVNPLIDSSPKPAQEVEMDATDTSEVISL